MSGDRLLRLSERWFRLLVRLYPRDFRDELGAALVETYRDRARSALERGGRGRLAGVWLRALLDSLRNGPGERARPSVRWRRTGSWGRDAEMALRRLVRAPLFTGAMIGTLTVGLGAFAVVYAVVHQVLIAPLPYRAPDDLYYVWRNYTWVQFERGWLGGTDVVELERVGGPVEGAAGLLQLRVTLSEPSGMEPTETPVIVTSPNLFDLLGVRPALGRTFTAEEVGPDRPNVIVLTHELWNRLGADPEITGTELRLNDEPYTVIGVLPRRFTFVRNASLGSPQRGDAFVPLDMHLAETDPNGGSYAGLIRVRPGTSLEQVTAAVAAVGDRIDERDFGSRGLELYPVGLKSDLVAGVRPALVVLGAVGAFLVLVLTVNLATLLLGRAAQREKEFAVSRALGANPVALVRATLLEGGLLGVLGGAAGALAGIWGTRVLVSLAPMDLPRREAIVLDWTVAGVVIAVGAVLGLLASTLPAAWAVRASLSALLRDAAVRGGGHGVMRRGLVIVQVALSLVLLGTGGLVVRSFERLLRADAGFEPDGVLTLRVPIPQQLYPEDADAIAVQDRIHAGLGALPGVQGVGATDALPLSADANQTTIRIPGAPGNTGSREHDAPLVDYIGTRAGYFDVMRMRVLDGHPMSDERRAGVKEALIDHVLAAHFFPTGSPLGARIPFGDDTLTVVGVVQQPRLYDVHRDDRGQLFVRAEDFGYRTLSFAVRSGRPAESIMADVRRVIADVDPRLAVAELKTMDEIVGDSLRQQRISAVLIAGFSLGALLLAAMGLFGVVSAAVTRRRHELAVRLALGAGHGRLLRLVLGEGARLIVAGALIGVPGTYLAGQAVRGVLVGISPGDPLTFVSVSLGLVLVATLACYLPARRVLAIEPARSLREE